MEIIRRVRRVLRRAFHGCLLFIGIVFSFSAAYGQKKGDPALEKLYSELDSMFANETVPFDLFALADSLLAIDTLKYSGINIRAGYVSDIVSLGRNFGFDQYGFSSAITYYHYSGFFGGTAGFWSNQYSPGYYLTNFSIGYLFPIKGRWNISFNHDFYLFNDHSEEYSFNKSAGATIYYQLRKADLGLDYGFLYGNEHAHRITAHLNGRIKFKLNGVIDAITLTPGASFQWGNANVLNLRQPRQGVRDLYTIIAANAFPSLTYRNYVRLANFLEKDRQGMAAYFLREKGYTDPQIATTFSKYYDGQIQETNAFGFMNYSFSFPVYITSGRWNFLVNYTHNIPVALPGEDFDLKDNGYFSTSLSYFIYWIKP